MIKSSELRRNAMKSLGSIGTLCLVGIAGFAIGAFSHPRAATAQEERHIYLGELLLITALRDCHPLALRWQDSPVFREKTARLGALR